MFKNKFVIIITVLVLFSIAIGLHFIGNEKNENFNNQVIMPEDVALVIETKNLPSLLNDFNKKNHFKYVFSDMIEWKHFFKLSHIMDTIMKENPDIASILEGNKVTMAARVGINNKLEFIYSVPIQNSDDEQYLFDVISSQKGENESITQQKYEGKLFYNFNQHNPARRLFSFALVNGTFIISKEKSLIEESFRIMTKPEKSIKHRGFTKLSQTAGDNSDMNIYLNYAYFPNMFKGILATRKSSFYDFFKQLADWTELDMRYKHKSLFMSGFTYVNKSKKRYLKVLKNQQSLPNEFLTALPRNTAAFLALNISNSEAWAKNYDTYLQEIGEYMPVMQHIDSISKRFLPKIKKLMFNNIGGAVCIAWIDKDMINKDLEVAGIVELKNPTSFANILSSSNKEIDNEKETEIDGNKVFTILEPKLLQYLFGDAFGSLSSNYGVIYENKLILARNVETLQLYLRKLKTIGSLKNDDNFKQFSKSSSSKSNIYAYINFELATPLITNNLSKRKARMYRRNIDKFSSVYALAIQYGVSEHGIYTNFCTEIDAKTRRNNQNMWEIALDTVFDMKPAIVKNHASGNNEILVQNKAHKLYFVNAQGKLRWKKQLDSKILGKIHQVDKYKNGKIQYLFNTRNRLYLVDRNGDDVQGFPIKFKSPATNACAVFDYDNNLKYRILIASSDKKVQLYDIDGKVVDGWLFTTTEGVVRMPAQHFVSDGKDYIIFADYNNTYIVNRKGEIRIKPNARFTKNANAAFFLEKLKPNSSRFVTIGQNSDIYFIYLDGSVKKMHLGNFSEHNKFLYADIDGNGKNEFIITDQNMLYAFNRDKSLRFKVEFKHNLKNSLNVYRFGKSLYFGVSPAGEHKIFLINTDGKVVKGFPMLGSGQFSITKLNKKNNDKKMDIITGNRDKYLFNYKALIK